jgi:hypothetical protein
MPEGNDLKKTVKKPVKNLVKEVLGDIVYRITKAGTKRAINELKKELKEKAFHHLQKKLEALSERKLDKLLDESAKRLTEEITGPGKEREELIKQIEQEFRQVFKKKLIRLIKVPVLKILAVTIVCLIAVGAGAYAAMDGMEPGDTIAPELIVRHIPPEPEPGQRITFIAEAGDNVGIDWIELLVNGEVVETSGSSPCVFEGGPYEEGSTVRYSAYAYDEAGNEAFSGERSLSISISERYPDLVITGFQVTGLLKWEEGDIYAPVHVVVRNQGTAAAGIFKVTVERQKEGEPYFQRPFTVPGQADSWAPYTGGPLPAGEEVVFEGHVNIGPDSEYGGLTVILRVTADSCLGDEFQPDYCRVAESNEDNNQYRIPVEVPFFVK